jgi:hypothetical protein
LTSNPKVTDTTKTDKPSSAEDTTGDPSSAQQDTQEHQGADRPAAIPSSEEHERIKETKREAEDASKVDTSGPGPKSLEEKARESGGDLGGGKEGEGDGLQKESHGEGTGELYVKSSGMVADGGDFDASRPGAGREADRECLLSFF